MDNIFVLVKTKVWIKRAVYKRCAKIQKYKFIKQNSKSFVPTIYARRKYFRARYMSTLNVRIIFSGLEMSQLSRL